MKPNPTKIAAIKIPYKNVKAIVGRKRRPPIIINNTERIELMI
jgi:hypothetical protein